MNSHQLVFATVHSGLYGPTGEVPVVRQFGKRGIELPADQGQVFLADYIEDLTQFGVSLLEPSFCPGSVEPDLQ